MSIGRAFCDLAPSRSSPRHPYTRSLLQDVSSIIAVYEAGYGASLVALLLALAILCYFK